MVAFAARGVEGSRNAITTSATAIEQKTADTVQLHRLVDLAREGNLTTANGGMEALPNLRGQVAQDEINIAQAINLFESNKILLFNVLNVPYRKDVDYQNSVTTTDVNASARPQPKKINPIWWAFMLSGNGVKPISVKTPKL